MIVLMPAEEVAKYRMLSLSDLGVGDSHDHACQPCDAFRPEPQRSGNLQVDPEIHLPSPGMDVDIAYFYNTTDGRNGSFGYGRSLSPYRTAQASGTTLVVTLTRGNGAIVTFQETGVGTGAFTAKTPGVLSTLNSDVPNALWKETTPDGFTTAYPLNTTGALTTVSYIEDAVGNRHTFGYSSGRLATWQDAVGRSVTFGYSGNLLATIQDWAGRMTSFQYDTTSAPGKSLLTTVTGPTGCQTAYHYAEVTLSGGNDWQLTGITDPNGYGTSYTYDTNGRVTTRTIATAGVTSLPTRAGRCR